MTATLRLLEALRSYGIDVRLLTLYEDQEQSGIKGVYNGRWGRWQALRLKVSERWDIFTHNSFRLDPLWRFSSASSGLDISNHAWVEWADVVHINWINQGFLSLSALRRLRALGKPIVWTLHDLWVSTGGCHLPMSFFPEGLKLCPCYGEGCGCCPLLSKPKPSDYSSHLIEQKAFLHNTEEPIHYVAVSHRAANLFNQSFLRRGHSTCAVIPPPMDLSPAISSEPYVYPEWYSSKKEYVLLAANRLDDEVKGYHLLPQIARLLADKSKDYDVELVLVGEIRRTELFENLALKTHCLGRLSADALRGLYRNVASLTISLSYFETFGQTLTESLSEGKPVVAFRSYGPEDIIQNGVNGYLVQAYDVDEMAHTICRVIEEKRAGGFRREDCQASLKPFSQGEVARAYDNLYRSLLIR